MDKHAAGLDDPNKAKKNIGIIYKHLERWKDNKLYRIISFFLLVFLLDLLFVPFFFLKTWLF